MAHSETTNTHLHKVLTHRNYMHHINLQKQLNIYDRQKKLVERELLQITKVRETIQQINKGSPKISQKFKKHDGTQKNPSKKSKNGSSSRLNNEKDVKKTKKRITGQEVVENCENRANNVYGEESLVPKNETMDQSSIQRLPVQVTADKQIQAILSDDPMEIDETKIKNQSTPAAVNEKLFTRRRPPYTKSSSEPSLVNPKLEEHVEQCEISRFPKTPTRMVGNEKNANSDEDLYRKSLMANHPNAEMEANGMKENEQRKVRHSQQTRMVKEDRCSNSDENLYRKSLLANQAAAEIKENEINSNGRCEIYFSSKSPTRMFKQGGYSNSDEDLYRKSLIDSDANGRTKLPTLPKVEGSELNNSSNLAKSARSFESEKNNPSPLFGGFPNNNVCLVQRSRPRSKTLSDLEASKPKAAWNSPGTQRRHKELSHFLNSFPNRDVCVVDRTRRRAATVSNSVNSFSQYGRQSTKTESCNTHPENQQRSKHDSHRLPENSRPRSRTVTGSNENWIKNGFKSTAGMEYGRNLSQSCESVRLSEDESIAIKGKFRQIGHSVLAIALMKKVAKK